MSARIPQLGPLWARTETRLVAFGAAALAAVYLGFLGVPVRAAEEFVKRGGYYIMAATVALFAYTLWGWWRVRGPAADPMTRRQAVLAGLAIGTLSLIAINAEPYHSKILNDEFVLQSTAFNMHFFRDVATMVRGYDIQGVFLSTDNYLDKRPYFYPFLVSLVHDLTGYRVANAFIVNSLLMPIGLALVFVFGRILAGWRGGMLALLLLGSLPLLGQNATGSGMELLNFVMIVACLVLGALFLQEPDETRVSAFALGVVLLAQSRYESALYALPAALVILAGWVRSGRIILPWPVILVPVLLVPMALQNKVLSNSPLMWELRDNETSRFSTKFLAGNLRGAIDFLFNGNAERANSVLLSGVGLLALGWAAWAGLRARPRLRAAPPGRLALACFAVAIVGNTVLVMFYYWANFDDPMASRFSLPFYLLMALAVVIMAADLDRWLPANAALLLLFSTIGLASATGKFGHHYYSHLGIDQTEWEKRFVAARGPGPILVLTNRSSLPWLLQKRPSIMLDRAKLMADRLAYQVHATNFREILVIQSAKPTTADGDHQLAPEERLPAYFKLELLAEKRFGTVLTRISRLVDVELPADWHEPGKPTPAKVPARLAATPALSE